MLLYDVAADIPKSSQYFYDDVHFNVEGARAAARGLARVVSTNLANSKAAGS